MSHLPHPKYRPDIDGLRAIAVLSVVAFHAFPHWASGGFTGVDVFFVISGFLISSIILEGLDTGTFTFVEFYARRIKRIFPALILVLAASFAAGWFVLLADELRQLSKHIVAGVAFLSNVALWREAGYFDASAATKPLQHLWSLGIEEQFYLFWPALLWFTRNGRFNRPTLMMLVTVASFVLNIWETSRDAVAAFYAPYTRLWELSCGSLLAWALIHRPPALVSVLGKLNERVRVNIAACAGVALLAAGIFSIRETHFFPGFWALIPVGGAVLVMAAGPTAWLNRVVLAPPVVVWFGLISYPLYLWHCPLLAFARIV